MRRFSLQNVESILGYTKRDLPKRTGPFHYVSVKFTPPQQPARLIFLLSCWLSDTYIWTGQHLNCIFRAFCTFCTLMSRIISQEYSFLLKEARSFCKNIHLRNKICLHPIFNFIGFYSIWSTIWSTFCQTIFSIVASHSLEGK